MAILTEEEREIDPYKVLGLEVSATAKDVQRAYRKKALKCHPDKHPGPEAAATFHLISVALAILMDPAKRNFVDTKLEQSRAQAARRAEMDAKRKAGVEDLIRREEEAKRARTDAQARRKAAAEEEAVRDAGRRLVEEARARAAAASKPKPAPEQAPASASQSSIPKPPPIGPLDLTLTLQLSPKTGLGTEDALRAALSKYGAVTDIVILPAKAKEGKKARGPRAVVEFAPGNWGGCWACLRDNSGSGNPIENGVKAKWAASEEPQWVAWAEKYASSSERANGTTKNEAASASAPASAAAPTPSPAPSFSSAPSFGSTPFGSTPFGSTPFGSAPSFSSAPDFGGDVSASLRAHERKTKEREDEAALKSAYESATLLRMRQKERERLEQQIRMQEAEDES